MSDTFLNQIAAVKAPVVRISHQSEILTSVKLEKLNNSIAGFIDLCWGKTPSPWDLLLEAKGHDEMV